jgi:predicted metal-dependent hydrolase
MKKHRTDTPLPGIPHVAVEWRRNPRARRISLRVSRLDGRVTLTLPPQVPRATAEAFLHERQEWLRAALAEAHAPCPVEGGTWLPVAGTKLCVTPAATGAVAIAGARLLVPERSAPGPRVAAWLKLRARDRLAESVEDFAARLGRAPRSLRLRDTRSRWGSCSSAGDLMFSWRLIMAPPEVLAYVAAHEVAHLAQMNHSPAYWQTLAGLMPDYAAPRAWLRTEGGALHRFRFAA